MNRYCDMDPEERIYEQEQAAEREANRDELREQAADERRDDLIQLLLATSRAHL